MFQESHAESSYSIDLLTVAVNFSSINSSNHVGAVIMDLIQMGVSVTCSWKYKSSVSVPRRGLPSPPHSVVTTFCTQPVFSLTTKL
jgi:hypothetical protein